jgi:hypothetical protein
MAKCFKNNAASECRGLSCRKSHLEIHLSRIDGSIGEVERSFCVSHWTADQIDKLIRYIEAVSANSGRSIGDIFSDPPSSDPLIAKIFSDLSGREGSRGCDARDDRPLNPRPAD